MKEPMREKADAFRFPVSGNLQSARDSRKVRFPSSLSLSLSLSRLLPFDLFELVTKLDHRERA